MFARKGHSMTFAGIKKKVHLISSVREGIEMGFKEEAARGLANF